MAIADAIRLRLKMCAIERHEYYTAIAARDRRVLW